MDDLAREDCSFLFRFVFRENLPQQAKAQFPTLSAGGDRADSFQHVKLAQRNLDAVPIYLFRFATSIHTLDVSRNLMLDLPLDFAQLCTNLQELRLSGNELTRAPAAVRTISTLTLLDLSHNNLSDLSQAGLNQLTLLTTLLLQSNQIVEIPEDLKALKQLSVLDLSNNSMNTFPLVVCSLNSLTFLDLSFNRLPSLPDPTFVDGLRKLRKLYLVANVINGQLPRNMWELRDLEEINMRGNNIADLSCFGNRPMNDAKGSGPNNSLGALRRKDEAIGNPHLKSLWVDHNGVTSLSNLDFDGLVAFSLSKNNLTRFSSLSSPVDTLTFLNISSSKLPVLPDNIFDNLTALQKLVLNDNHMNTLPQSMGGLSELKILTVANNNLSALPKELGLLQQLEWLDVRNNNLKSLPSRDLGVPPVNRA